MENAAQKAEKNGGIVVVIVMIIETNTIRGDTRAVVGAAGGSCGRLSDKSKSVTFLLNIHPRKTVEMERYTIRLA